MYLDSKGLVALWRETLLAKHVLEGKTRGYRNHPQLNRFKASVDSVGSINQYLASVLVEAKGRGYNFDETKIDWNFQQISIKVTDAQVQFEAAHLLAKLETRDPSRFTTNTGLKHFEVHPIFQVVSGKVEDWEVI